jgi:hypothetical protein
MGQRESERAGAQGCADRVGPRDRERERQRAGTQGCADRWDPPVRQRGRTRGLGLLGCLGPN